VNSASYDFTSHGQKCVGHPNLKVDRNVLVLNRLPHQNRQKISNYIINDQTLLRIIKF
jgi:hypothetical protein